MEQTNKIEEMAKDFCALNMPCEECHLYKNRCHAKKYATRAYNAGYRKASEIFEEIESCIWSETQYGDSKLCFEINSAKYAELKKKYT